MARKKLQIFISSTYTDLKEERQASVEAILGSRHIPAGMELFKAGNTSQLQAIKKWINESDLYMLILGGRYGSIEPNSGKSYTQIEYEYAIEKEIPVFAVILSDSFLHKKASQGSYNVFEIDNKEKYYEFKTFVMTKIIKPVDDCKDIQISIKDSIVELEIDYPLCGWVRASEIEDSTKIIKENNTLIKENEKLKSQFQKIKEEDRIGKFGFEDLKKTLDKKKIKFPKEVDVKEPEVSSLMAIKAFKDRFITGIENNYSMGKLDEFIFFDVAPFLIQFELLEINKVAGVTYRRLEMTEKGREFLARIEVENNK